MTARYIPKSAWTRKGKAKHFQIAAKSKTDRAVRAWLKLSKSKSK